MNKLFKISSLISVLWVLTVDISIAEDAVSWNLSQDMSIDMTKNPTGVWAFMQNKGTHNPVNYTLLQNHSSNGTYPMDEWLDVQPFPYIGMLTKNYRWLSVGKNRIKALKGTPHLHPGKNGRQAIVRWKSPITGKVSLLGKVADVEHYCGDGVSWSLEKGTTVIQSGTVQNNGAVFSVQDVQVSKGEALYFIVDGGNDADCDTTNLDLLVTGKFFPNKQAKFLEVIAATSAVKIAVDQCAKTLSAYVQNPLDSGFCDADLNVQEALYQSNTPPVSAHLSSITFAADTITATAGGTDFPYGETYVLRGSYTSTYPSVTWTVDPASTCLYRGYC